MAESVKQQVRIGWKQDKTPLMRDAVTGDRARYNQIWQCEACGNVHGNTRPSQCPSCGSQELFIVDAA